MSQCERFEADISAWLDEELDRVNQVELTDHLVSCESCRGFYMDARALDGWVAAIRKPQRPAQPSPDVWQSIQSRVEPVATKPAPSSVSWKSQWWRAAAMLVLAAGLGLFFAAGVNQVDTPQPVEFELGQGGTTMTEDRFIQLAGEVLRADPRYHTAMYQVMQQAVADSGAMEASWEFAPSEEDRDETPGEQTPAGNPV